MLIDRSLTYISSNYSCRGGKIPWVRCWSSDVREDSLQCNSGSDHRLHRWRTFDTFSFTLYWTHRLLSPLMFWSRRDQRSWFQNNRNTPPPNVFGREGRENTWHLLGNFTKQQCFDSMKAIRTDKVFLIHDDIVKKFLNYIPFKFQLTPHPYPV